MIYQFQLFPFGFTEQSFEKLKAQIDSYEMSVIVVNNLGATTSQNISAVVIDLDEGNLDEKLNDCRELLPDRPIIGLSNSPIRLDGILTLEKPLNRNNLSLILGTFASQKKEHKQKTREIRAIYSNHNSLLHYPIKNCFQEYLVKAWKIHKRVKQPIELIFLNKPILVLYQNKVNTLLSNERLQQLCALTIHEHSLTTSLVSAPPTELQHEDVIDFITKIVMWSSQGRLPDGVNSTDIIRIAEPDKLDSLPKIDGTDLIRTFWLYGSYSLQQIEHDLQVSQTLLYSYFSALYALDFVQVFPTRPSSKAKLKNKKNNSKWAWLENKLFFHNKKLVSG